MMYYVLGAIVRFFLWLQQLTKLPYWISVAVVLPLYWFLECVLNLRFMLFFNLNNLASLAMGSNLLTVASLDQQGFRVGNLDITTDGLKENNF